MDPVTLPFAVDPFKENLVCRPPAGPSNYHISAPTNALPMCIRLPFTAEHTEHTECTECRTLSIFLGDLGDLLRNTKFNAETAEPAEKNPLKLCDLCVLCVQPL